MSAIKLYPPGGGEPIIPHPARVEEMKDKGWTEKPAQKPKTTKEVKQHG